MSVRRIAYLLGRELRYGSLSFVVIFAIFTPLLVTLVLNLVFGSLFAEIPRLGIVDEGDSTVVDALAEEESLVSTIYASAGELEEAVAIGAEDAGVVLPAGFDQDIASGDLTELTAFIWGQSLARNRLIVSVALANTIRDLTGAEPPVDIVSTILGETELLSITDRLLPLIILIAVFFGGMLAPATSLVEEKQKRTLTAITTTPTRLEEIFIAKGIVGVLLSTVVVLLTLALNRAWGPDPLLLVSVLLIGAIFAACFGLILGMLVNDITSLFAVVKGIGLLIYAPAFFYLFPQLPQWIARLFPTYYILEPVLDITQRGAQLEDILPELAMLMVFIALAVGVLLYLARRTRGTGRITAPALATKS